MVRTTEALKAMVQMEECDFLTVFHVLRDENCGSDCGFCGKQDYDRTVLLEKVICDGEEIAINSPNFMKLDGILKRVLCHGYVSCPDCEIKMTASCLDAIMRLALDGIIVDFDG